MIIISLLNCNNIPQIIFCDKQQHVTAAVDKAQLVLNLEHSFNVLQKRTRTPF